MNRLLYCFVFVFILMACSTHPTIEGRWAMEMNGIQDTAIVVNGDTIIAPELRIDYDSIYMEVWSNGTKTSSENIGVYSIEDDRIIVTDRYGKQKINRFVIKDDILTVLDKDNPNKIIMRLIRIKEGK